MHSVKSAETLSRPEWIWLAVITLLGMAIRIVYQIDRPFIADEIGTLKHIEMGYGYLLTHHETWLTMNFFLMAEKFLADLFGPTPAALTALPLLFGVAAIPLAALVARRFMEPAPCLAAALLTALNPYLIAQSLNIRSYSMLVTLSLAAILLFLHWQENPDWRSGARFALAAFFFC